MDAALEKRRAIGVDLESGRCWVVDTWEERSAADGEEAEAGEGEADCGGFIIALGKDVGEELERESVETCLCWPEVQGQGEEVIG